MGLGGLLPRDAEGHRLTSADDLCILTEEEESTQAYFSSNYWFYVLYGVQIMKIRNLSTLYKQI